MKLELKAESSSLLLKDLRDEIGASQNELARWTWLDRALIARIELGREPKLPTMRRFIAALGGRLELAARFERPLEALRDDFTDLRHARRRMSDRRRHERNLARWTARGAERTAA